MKHAAKKAKQISQETFDEVVKENVDDFDMPLDEATRDAIAQFESQGVDLSNIIKRVGGGDSADANGDAEEKVGAASLSSAEEELKRLKSLVEQLKTQPLAPDSETQIVEKLDQFAAMLELVPEMKVIAGRNDAIDPLVALLSSGYCEIVEKASALLAAVCADNSDNQDFVGQAGVEQFALALTTASAAASTVTAMKLLNGVRVVCAKYETNKAHFAKAKGIDAVCLFLDRAKEDDVLAKHVAAVLRVLTINDDPKATFSQAQDTIKALVAKDLIPYIIEVVQTRREQPDLLSAWLIVLKQLAITEEHCKKIYDLAGLDLLFQVMLQHERNLTVVKRCVTVFRNVAAADELKEYIITSGGAEQIMAAMQTHLADASMQQHACATLAAIALRSPENSARIVDLGAARMIAFAMRTHQTDTALLRQASLAIRNMVARAPELRIRILEEDVEELLRDAQKYRGCGDEVYAALRDLGCDIKLSSFGTGALPKAQFNPVNVESGKLLDAVDKAAEAPFAQYS